MCQVIIIFFNCCLKTANFVEALKKAVPKNYLALFAKMLWKIDGRKNKHRRNKLNDAKYQGKLKEVRTLASPCTNPSKQRAYCSKQIYTMTLAYLKNRKNVLNIRNQELGVGSLKRMPTVILWGKWRIIMRWCV